MIRNRAISLLIACLLVLGACSSGDTTDTTTNNSVPSGCTEVPVATSPEKFTLLTGLAETFNATGQEFDGQCAAITVYRVRPAPPPGCCRKAGPRMGRPDRPRSYGVPRQALGVRSSTSASPIRDSRPSPTTSSGSC